MLSLQQVLYSRVWWNIIWTFLPCEIADRAEMTSDTCHCCMWSPFSTSRQGLLSVLWRVLCKYSVRSMSFHILLSPFFSFHIIFRTTSCHLMSFHIILYHFMSFHIILYHFMSFHVTSCHFISFRFYQPHFIQFDGTMRNDTVWSLWGSQRHSCTTCIHMHLRQSWWINRDISVDKSWNKVVSLDMWWCLLTQVKFTHTSRSGWNILYFDFRQTGACITPKLYL